MYTLYWSRNTGAITPEVMLEEAGLPYRRVEVDYRAGAQNRASYRKINPMGQIPVLRLPGGEVVSESAAIVLTLADRHPEAGFLPPAGSAERASAYRWLTFMAVNLYMADLRAAYPARYTVYPNGAAAVKARAQEHLDQYWRIIDTTALAKGPFLAGATPGAVDVYLAMLALWHPDRARLFEDCPRVRRVFERLTARPVVAQVFKAHGKL
ncbi:MAG: glutathione S-transferase family protein [Alphaproteobacteria bacterium]|nr:glutathione S-transferase family protein [Alphaproteobacteria bacterium]